MLSYKYLVEEYVDKQRSTHEIADELGVYPNKIRRALIKYGIPVRNRSDAQTAALKNGTQHHPTKGVVLSSEHREKIGESTRNAWEAMTEEERIRRSEISKGQWEKKGDDEKECLRDMALDAVRKTAKLGSRLEKYLMRGLSSAGYENNFHVPLDKQHIDIFIPKRIRSFTGIAIEVNGPSHYRPIWGSDTHTRRAEADARKIGLLSSMNYLVIVMKNISGESSGYSMREALQKLLGLLELVSSDLGGLASYYEIEV